MPDSEFRTLKSSFSSLVNNRNSLDLGREYLGTCGWSEIALFALLKVGTIGHCCKLSVDFIIIVLPDTCTFLSHVTHCLVRRMICGQGHK